MSIRYVTDESGKRVAVLLDIKEYERMVEKLEDIADACAADEVRAAIARGEDEFIPYEQAREEIAKARAAKR
jgi:PHD/YefM family antitoxin component YafN of YafNO toxin-antitoxin module